MRLISLRIHDWSAFLAMYNVYCISIYASLNLPSALIETYSKANETPCCSEVIFMSEN